MQRVDLERFDAAYAPPHHSREVALAASPPKWERLRNYRSKIPISIGFA